MYSYHELSLKQQVVSWCDFDRFTPNFEQPWNYKSGVATLCGACLELVVNFHIDYNLPVCRMPSEAFRGQSPESQLCYHPNPCITAGWRKVLQLETCL